jgi:hypothetical protein
VPNLVITIQALSQEDSAPVSNGSLPDQTYIQGTGPGTIDASTGFVGKDLVYSLEAGIPAASIDASSGLITIGTADIVPDTRLVVKAANAHGSATSGFRLRVSAPETGSGVGHWNIGHTFIVS